MGLIKELKIQTIVIVAQSFNPSIFNQHWLIKNNFVDETDIAANSIFMPGVINLFTKNYNLLVLPEKLQFQLINSGTSFKSDIEKALLPIIEKLPEVPYKAIGINFSWHITDTEKSIIELSKELFYFKESKLHQNFNSDNARFGAYMSNEYMQSRLKLDIKTVKAVEINTSKEEEVIQFAFNFHIDFNVDNCQDLLIGSLNDWEEYRKEAERIINIL